MKSKGFRKIGKYDYGTTYEKAVYESSQNTCNVIFTAHPYVYPANGIQFEKVSDGHKVLEKQYLFEDGDLAFLIDALARDLKSGEISI